MRIAADGTAVAFTHGYGGGDLTIRIVDTATGRTLAVLPAGHDPRWLASHTLVARSVDGLPADALEAGYQCTYVGANDGDMDACNSRAAYAYDRSAGVTVHATNAQPRSFPQTFEPALSPGGTIALRDLASGSIRLERLHGCIDPPARLADLGPATRLRWSSGTAAWDSLPYGRVLARSTPDQATLDLSVPGRSCVMPVPLWTGRQLFVGLVLDDGELAVATWDGLVRQDGLGWRIGISGGSAFDWDLATVPGRPDVLCAAYLSPLAAGLAAHRGTRATRTPDRSRATGAADRSRTTRATDRSADRSRGAHCADPHRRSDPARSDRDGS